VPQRHKSQPFFRKYKGFYRFSNGAKVTRSQTLSAPNIHCGTPSSLQEQIVWSWTFAETTRPPPFLCSDTSCPARKPSSITRATTPQEPTLLSKVQIHFADFPYSHCSNWSEAFNLGDLLRILVRLWPRESDDTFN
jgi:hypothetical protein